MKTIYEFMWDNNNKTIFLNVKSNDGTFGNYSFCLGKDDGFRRCGQPLINVGTMSFKERSSSEFVGLAGGIYVSKQIPKKLMPQAISGRNLADENKFRVEVTPDQSIINIYFKILGKELQLFMIEVDTATIQIYGHNKIVSLNRDFCQLPCENEAWLTTNKTKKSITLEFFE